MLATAGWVLVLTVAFNVALAAQLSRQADDLTLTRAEAVSATVDVDPDGGVAVREGRGDEAIDVGTWIYVGERLVESPPRARGLDATAAGLVGRGEQWFTTGGSDPVRMLALPVDDGGQQVATIVVSQSLGPYRQTEELAVVGSVLLGLLVLAGVYLVVRESTDRALRPVEEMTAQAARWSAGDVDRRFGLEPRAAELDQLAATLDGVLDRISAVLRHERAFSDHLSHELRTPLAAVVAEVDLLLESGGHPPEVTAALRQTADAAQRMTRILDTLMAAARSTAGRPRGRCELNEAVVPLAREWPEPPVLDVELGVGTVVGVDADVLTQMLSPLLANARRFAASRVRVTARAGADAVVIAVADDGPGIAPGDLAHVFEPGWRGAPDDGDGHDGAGLGLSLVRRLATVSGGTVQAMDKPAGATIELRLPRG